MSKREVRWIDTNKNSHELLNLNSPKENDETKNTQEKVKNRDILWLSSNDQSQDSQNLGGKLGGFIGTNVLIAHRTKASDCILYNFLLERAVAKRSTIILPQKEPHKLPSNFYPIELAPEKAEKRRTFQEGKVYRVLIDSYDAESGKLNIFYQRLLASKRPDFSFVVIFDTLKKWSHSFDEHIRFLLRESPLVQGSIWLHCPLPNIPPDLLSVFGSVIVIWPSQNEIELLNTHFPAEKIPAPISVKDNQSNNRMLVFNSHPMDERGWEWHKYPKIK